MGQQRVVPIFLRYSDVHLIKNGRLALVDAGYRGNEKRILDVIREEATPKELALIIITHGHMDHIGGLPELRKTLGARILAHRDEVGALRTGKSVSPKKTSMLGRLIRGKGDRNWEPIEPEIIVDRETDLKDFGVNGTVIPTPGHTAGSISILLDSGDALVGDLIVGGLINHQKPSHSLFAEDKEQVTKSVMMLLERGAKVFYGSHGGPFTADEVRKSFSP